MCARAGSLCVFVKKARDKVGEHCVSVLYSGNNVSERKKKKYQAVKKKNA